MLGRTPMGHVRGRILIGTFVDRQVLSQRRIQLRAYQITDYTGVDSLACVEVPDGEPGPGEIKVNIKASSINYRDLVTIEDPAARNLSSSCPAPASGKRAR